MTYTVVVSREDGAWLADVPSVPGAHTFARSLDGLDRSVREVIIVMNDLPDDAEVSVEYVYDVDDPVVSTAAQLGKERMVLAGREADVKIATAKMVRELSGHGYSVRDAAHLLGITPGRVSQLVNS